LLSGFTPNACSVAGPTASFDGGSMQVAGPDHITCYYSSVAPGTPMAFLEQVVETAEGQGLVHVRLTMNPAFVDNALPAPVRQLRRGRVRRRGPLRRRELPGPRRLRG
jgi:hypothetical protein